MKGFSTFIASLSKLDLNMTQNGAEKNLFCKGPEGGGDQYIVKSSLPEKVYIKKEVSPGTLGLRVKGLEITSRVSYNQRCSLFFFDFTLIATPSLSPMFSIPVHCTTFFYEIFSLKLLNIRITRFLAR